MTYRRVEVNQNEIAHALLQAVIDDLQNTDNMTGRITCYLGYADTDAYVATEDMVKAANWLGEFLQPLG